MKYHEKSWNIWYNDRDYFSETGTCFPSPEQEAHNRFWNQAVRQSIAPYMPSIYAVVTEKPLRKIYTAKKHITIS